MCCQGKSKTRLVFFPPVVTRASRREELLNESKLLLLGSASAGKSTFAKQMKILFLNGFSESELAMYREHVHYCIWRNMRTLAGRPNVKVSRRGKRRLFDLEKSRMTRRLRSSVLCW